MENQTPDVENRVWLTDEEWRLVVLEFARKIFKSDSELLTRTLIDEDTEGAVVRPL